MITKVIDIWKKHIADTFPWGESCWHCNDSKCDPKHCRSIGRKVDK